MLLGGGLFRLGLFSFGLIDLSQDGDCSFELGFFAFELFEPFPQIVLFGEVGVAGGDEVLLVGLVHEIVICRPSRLVQSRIP